ncbi:MAG: SiaB family protein kinase [Campylobacterota bacterium]|nr:SiaB family protein kinase [Campylobacterota bacterium]
MDISLLRKVMDDNGIIFSFSGTISQELLMSIVETIKKELENVGTQNKIKDSIFIVAIEQMQNIMSYAKDKQEYENNKYSSSGIFVVGFDNVKAKFFVASSNKVKHEDKIKVQTKLDKINSLDTKEQRKFLRELLRSGDLTHSRGAGVGFVEMAKRSSEPLEYNFLEFNDDDYFELKVYIG